MRAILLASSLLSAAAAQPPRAATVSFLEGTAQVRRGQGIPQDVRQGSTLHPGDLIETGDDSRLELKLDAIELRLGPRTRLVLPAAPRGVPAARQVPVELLSGKLHASPSDRDLQVGTEHALLRARAAGFRLDAHEDHSVLVRVYSGSVDVRNAPDQAPKQSLAGRAARPKPWEKTVGKGMQMLIGADGTPGLPAPFTEADEKDDDWAAWNRKRDGQGK